MTLSLLVCSEYDSDAGFYIDEVVGIFETPDQAKNALSHVIPVEDWEIQETWMEPPVPLPPTWTVTHYQNEDAVNNQRYWRSNVWYIRQMEVGAEVECSTEYFSPNKGL